MEYVGSGPHQRQGWTILGASLGECRVFLAHPQKYIQLEVYALDSRDPPGPDFVTFLGGWLPLSQRGWPMPEKMFVSTWMHGCHGHSSVLETLTAYYSSVKIFRQWRSDKYGVLAIQSSELRNAYTRKGRGICEGPIPKTGIKISQRSEEAIFLMKSFGAFLTECPAIYFAFVWQIQTKITNWFNSVGR